MLDHSNIKLMVKKRKARSATKCKTIIRAAIKEMDWKSTAKEARREMGIPLEEAYYNLAANQDIYDWIRYIKGLSTLAENLRHHCL